MKKFKLKQVTMALSASSVLLTSGMFSPPAHALRDLLFPYITTETGKFTFITILNDGSATGFNTNFHFTYGMKPAPVVAKAGCQHFDGDVPTTLGDMMIFEVNGKVTEPGTALFEGGSTPPVTSGPLAYPIAGQQGFLIVNQVVGADAFLHGWASVVDSATGLTWTYSTSGLTRGNATTASASADFSPIDGVSDMKFTSWYPQTIVPTSWVAVPLGTRDAMSPAGGGGIRRGLVASVDHTITGVATGGTAGAFNLDEQFFSGGKNIPIRCFGTFTRADLLQPAVDTSTAGGGWIPIVPTTLTLSATDSVDPSGSYTTGPWLLFKVQTTTALGAAKTTINRETSHNDFDGVVLTP